MHSSDDPKVVGRRERLRCSAEGGKLVVMHPKSLEVAPFVKDVGGFRIEKELEIYIHRTLTRTITVLRRRARG